jgi:hypothetical protein
MGKEALRLHERPTSRIIESYKQEAQEVPHGSPATLHLRLPARTCFQPGGGDPPRQRNQFVAEAVKARLRDLEREALRADMEECARIMHDEIMQIEAEFAPLDAEVDRLL